MREFLETEDTRLTICVLEAVLILLQLYSANNNQDYMCQTIAESGGSWIVNLVLESIQNHESSSDKSIRKLTVHILDKYFSNDQEQDDKDEEIQMMISLILQIV
ncbi:hypothetical protein RF11_05441 [Thelohanellus kitauei]|uniref:Uncharacterized protein n=1 Tax=Thelohanellus kitauei TaxID=669202 RepID=A0A0C2I9H3_THEKT|nr:hypothetical protein RF11_05441 [Thelohanellus kitauei]